VSKSIDVLLAIAADHARLLRAQGQTVAASLIEWQAQQCRTEIDASEKQKTEKKAKA
jgi:hypothetical protein